MSSLDDINFFVLCEKQRNLKLKRFLMKNLRCVHFCESEGKVGIISEQDNENPLHRLDGGLR